MLVGPAATHEPKEPVPRQESSFETGLVEGVPHTTTNAPTPGRLWSGAGGPEVAGVPKIFVALAHGKTAGPLFFVNP